MLAELFKKNKLQAILITDLNNVRFLTGFTGTNGLVIATKKKKFFVTDSRYTQQAKRQVRGAKIIEADRSLLTTLEKIIKQEKVRRLGVEANHLSHGRFLYYKKIFKKTKLVPLLHDPGLLRIIKTPAEIENIKKALEINAQAFKKLRSFIKPGVTEVAVARRLEATMLSLGAEKIAFDTIIASGPRGALPHGVASTKKLRAGELVTIDFGCVVNGFYSDETVTICLGTPNAKQKKIWQIVRDAQQAAAKLAKPGVACADLDKAARDFITQAGYGKYFGHALGHGVGLEIHERPVLSGGCKDMLKPGMVFTIEPGIYLPGWGGVRIEDVYECTKTGARQLSHINKILP
jgi:Xaa-Pro aminopeptidase